MTRSRTGAGLAVAGLLAILIAGGWLLAGRRLAPAPVRDPAVRPAPPVAAPWTQAQLADLLGAVSHADAEGLRATDYQLDALRLAATARRTGVATDALADKAALALAHDYAAGRVRDRHRFGWYIDGAGPGPAELTRGLAAARARGRLRDWLGGLLPSDPRYGVLRDALAATPAADSARRDRLRANMERWRWLPRDAGPANQLYVNLPSYRLEVVQDGRTVATYRAVIGATDMPTPALSVPVRAVIANPDWIVPQSIVRRSHLRPGRSSRYTFTARPDGTMRVRQKPGPHNALGRVKIVFPNPLAIYFHDTPSKSLFGAAARAFSHGCVRVEDIEALAASLVARPDGFAAALAGARTRGFATARPWQAVIVYLTLAPGEDGGLVDLGDPYRLDGRLAAALDGRRQRRAAPDLPARARRAAAAPPRAVPTVDPDDAVLDPAGTGTAPDTQPRQVRPSDPTLETAAIRPFRPVRQNWPDR